MKEDDITKYQLFLELQKSVGFHSHYWRFIRGFAKIAKPLYSFVGRTEFSI